MTFSHKRTLPFKGLKSPNLINQVKKWLKKKLTVILNLSCE